MPDGSSSAAPVMRPGPKSLKNLRTGRGLAVLLSACTTYLSPSESSISEIEVCDLMTFFAIRKILDAESALVVVTDKTTLRSRRSMMHQSLRCCDLSSLRHSGSSVVTIITTQTLACCVPRVAEAHTVSAGLH